MSPAPDKARLRLPQPLIRPGVESCITVHAGELCRGEIPILALIAPGEIFGGAERQILTLCRYLKSHGRPATVFLFHDRLLAQHLRACGCSVEILAGNGPASMSRVRHLSRRFAELGVRVAHVNGYKAAFHVWLAIRGRAVGVLKTEHGRPELHAASLASRLKARLYAVADTHATRASRAHMVYVTRELCQFFERVYHGLRTSVVYNGIEPLLHDNKRRPEDFASGDFNVAIVGRLEPVKAVHLALEALGSPSVPTNIRLHVVGDGPLREQLTTQAQRLGLSSRVVFHGFRSDVHDYIASADALLIPSLHEGLPYTVLEAMALGTPVIAAAVGGLREILEHDRTAILFSPGESAAVAAALQRAAQNATLLAHLRAEALRDVHERFSAESMGGAYCRLYDQLAADSKPD